MSSSEQCSATAVPSWSQFGNVTHRGIK